MNRYFHLIKRASSVMALLSISICSMLYAVTGVAQQSSSIDTAVQAVRNETQGKIISADTITIDNKRQHRIKVLMPNGHVKVFYKPVTN